MKVFDAHLHVGFFPRKDGKGGEAYYYSPARLMQYVNWAGIDEFIVSSTNATWDVRAETMHPEALELKRIAGERCHPFFWLTKGYLHWDSSLRRIPAFYEGIKLHGGESHWTEHPKELWTVLSFAAERNLSVQIHTGKDAANSCLAYLPFCRQFPQLRFDLAHGWPCDGANAVLKSCPNVWIDISFTEEDTAAFLCHNYPDRIMFGTDFPAPLRFYNVSGTKYLRRIIRTMRKLGGEALMHENASAFLRGEAD